MINRLFIKLVRLWGWLILAISLCVILVELITNSGEFLDFGYIVIFAALGTLGFFLTRYKNGIKFIFPKQKEKQEKVFPEEDPLLDEELPENFAYREVMAKSKDENSLLHIEYVDSFGKASSGVIEIKKFKISDGKLYIYAYCHHANALRQFLADRISSISIGGQTMENPAEFLWESYKNSAA